MKGRGQILGSCVVDCLNRRTRMNWANSEVEMRRRDVFGVIGVFKSMESTSRELGFLRLWEEESG